MVQVSKKLLVRAGVVVEDYRELMNSLDIALAEHYCKEKKYEKGLELYRNILPLYMSKPEYTGISNKFFNYSLMYGGELTKDKKWAEATELYKNLMRFTGFPVAVYKNIGLCMKSIGNADLAIKFLKRFEEVSPDKEDIYIYLADLIYTDIKDYVKAIEYYEKALEKNPNNYSLYNMLGHLYSTHYQDKYKDKQINYFRKALELAPQNRVVVKNLAYVYGKFDEVELADEMYARVLELNPLHNDLHAYGAYLVRHLRFQEGFKYLQHRFMKEDLNAAFPPVFLNKKKRWNPKVNLADKHLLIHFEQGFGDTLMFGRFIDEAKKRCKKATLVVQNSLITLYQESNLGIDILAESQVPDINFDYVIPTMDLPLLCETTHKTIPNTKGYLKIPREKVLAYGKEYINKNKKFKIGIAYEGTLSSKETDRDIPLEFMYPLMMRDDIEVYSFQVEDLTRQMDRIPEGAKLIRLGSTFKSWQDTGAAMKNMDLMISTDNGVMNLAGTLGIKTFGLFNRITEWRWFKVEGNDVGWYKSIRPFQCPTSKAWGVVMEQVMAEVDKLIKEKNNK